MKTQAAEISIHALLAESDDLHRGEMVLTARISIHALLAESDSPKVLKVKRTTADFYPRSPCGERLYANFDGFYWWVISIHALLAESDLFLCCNAAKPRHFYPRSPCGERRCRPGNCTRCCAFLSTLSLRRATNTNLGRHRGNDDFYPRSPCGERLDMSSAYPAVQCISIHALLAESDQT